ncbi:hypothetical protein K8I85_18740, partial [bacterium]|nr:hypothetical protein [bacterium]
ELAKDGGTDSTLVVPGTAVDKAAGRYRPGDFVGRMGLERVHEPALQGYAGSCTRSSPMRPTKSPGR